MQQLFEAPPVLICFNGHAGFSRDWRDICTGTACLFKSSWIIIDCLTNGAQFGFRGVVCVSEGGQWSAAPQGAVLSRFPFALSASDFQNHSVSLDVGICTLTTAEHLVFDKELNNAVTRRDFAAALVAEHTLFCFISNGMFSSSVMFPVD